MFKKQHLFYNNFSPNLPHLLPFHLPPLLCLIAFIFLTISAML